MTKQPEALRLADALTQPTYPDWVMHIPAPWHPPAQKVREAAAELRRLSAVEAQRDALLAEHQQTLALQQRSYEREIQLEVEAEREECAKVCEGGSFLHDDAPDARFGKACAAAIRARGNA